MTSRIITFASNVPTCDLCHERIFDAVYDARVSTYRGITWANTCKACFNTYGVGKAEPFVWSNSHQAFIKEKPITQEQQFLMDMLGLDADEAEACL